MTCPNSKCASQILDDSLFCDQCGKSIMKCPKCGALGTSKYCTKDGSQMQPRLMENVNTGSATDTSKSPFTEHFSQENSKHNSSDFTDGATVRIKSHFQNTVLHLLHAGGSQLDCSNETVIGRKVGPHASYLSGYPYMSGQHGKIVNKSGTWFYIDLSSTNGTRINGNPCIPHTEYMIKPKDILELADQKFQVL